MKICPHPRLFLIIILTTLLSNGAYFPSTQAQTLDAWWHNDWPYRVPVTLATTGITALNLDFSQLFHNLGLNEALLDLRSVRVIPYTNGLPGSPVQYQETYSTLLMDGESLNFDNNAPPYWFGGQDTALELDNERYTQGSSAIHSRTTITTASSIESEFLYHFNGTEHADWSDYEILLYDIWPEVNDSAIDQTPDLFHFELGGLGNCPIDHINGPALAMDQWNQASVSLKPFGNCAVPNLSGVDSIRFYTLVNRSYANNGDFDPGDELDLWLDHFRLVDQDGQGQIRWLAQEGVERYYIYFDTINHDEHPPPELIEFSESTTVASPGAAQAGGYFHQIAGANPGGLTIWNAPPTEKILPTCQAPITTKPLSIHAARGEFEPIQLVVRSPTTQSLSVSLSDLTHENEIAIIPTRQIDLFRVDYVKIAHLSDFYGRLGAWPDPLYPVPLGNKITFSAGTNQPLWFRVKVPETAQPGLYSATIHIGSQTTVPFTLEVWPFSLPISPSLDIKIGFDWETVRNAYSGDDKTFNETCDQQFSEAINQTLADFHLTPINTNNLDQIDDLSIYTLTSYEVIKAQKDQYASGERVWWEFAPGDYPPLTNPGVMDRPGSDARILPWMAWLNRVDSLYYPQVVDWDEDPWKTPFSNELSNGDGFLFYPPKDETIGFNPCVETSNRLIPSLRLELLREGLEDYAYLELLNNGSPLVNQDNVADHMALKFIFSRTAYNRAPTTFNALRFDLAKLLRKDNFYYLPLIYR